MRLVRLLAIAVLLGVLVGIIFYAIAYGQVGGGGASQGIINPNISANQLPAPSSLPTTGAYSPGPSIGSSQYNAGAGLFGGNGAVLNAAAYPGADWCAKVSATQTALGGSGTVDAGGLSGAQNCALGLTINAGDKVLVGAATITVASGHQILLSNNNSMLTALNRGVSLVTGTVSGDGLVKLTGTNDEVSNLAVTNSATASGSAGVALAGAPRSYLHVLTVAGGYYGLSVVGGSYYSRFDSIIGPAIGGSTINLYIQNANDLTFTNLVLGGDAVCVDDEYATGISINNLDCENGSGGVIALQTNQIAIGGGWGSAQVAIMGGYREQNGSSPVVLAGSANDGGAPQSVLITGFSNFSGGVGCAGRAATSVVALPGIGTGCTTLQPDYYGGLQIRAGSTGPGISLFDERTGNAAELKWDQNDFGTNLLLRGTANTGLQLTGGLSAGTLNAGGTVCAQSGTGALYTTGSSCPTPIATATATNTPTATPTSTP